MFNKYIYYNIYIYIILIFNFIIYIYNIFNAFIKNVKLEIISIDKFIYVNILFDAIKHMIVNSYNNQQVNGWLTLNENIADNVGVEVAFLVRCSNIFIIY